MLKLKIEQIQNIPSYQQKLIFTGTLMEDKNSLFDYGITSDSLVQLVVKSEAISIPQALPRETFLDTMLYRSSTPLTPRSPIISSPTGSKISPLLKYGINSVDSPSEYTTNLGEFKRKNGPFKLKRPGSKSSCLCTIYISEFRDDSIGVLFYRVSYSWEYASTEKSEARDCCWCSINPNNKNINSANLFIATNQETKMSGLTIEKNELSTNLIMMMRNKKIQLNFR